MGVEQGFTAPSPYPLPRGGGTYMQTWHCTVQYEFPLPLREGIEGKAAEYAPRQKLALSVAPTILGAPGYSK